MVVLTGVFCVVCLDVLLVMCFACNVVFVGMEFGQR